MDMPCNCPECGEIVELNDMIRVGSEKICYHNLVCIECYENLESED